MTGNFSIPSGHCWPQDRGLNPCGHGMFSFWPAENCAFDGPGALLSHIYGPLVAPAESIVTANLHRFNQTAFDSTERPFLSKYGLLYAPTSCIQGAKCKLHIVVHGGGTPFWVVEKLAHGGMLGMSYNRWAETNEIVTMWPHAGNDNLNPEKCGYGGKGATKDEQVGNWDTYGHTGKLYDTREGIQMQALARMIKAVSGVQL